MVKKFVLFGWCLVMVMADVGWCDNVPRPAKPDLSAPLSSVQCIEIALQQNRKRHISRAAVEIAESQHKQALSSFWPELTFESAYSRLDEDVTFVFPEETSTYTISMPPLLPFPVESEVTIPEKRITVLDRETLMSRLNMTYPLFTGGLRSNMVKATRAGIQAAKHALRRTELELILDVQRMYYGAVLAKRLADIGRETLTRLETSTDITERLYKEGSGSVTRLDYLRSKVVLESARSIVTILTSNVDLAIAALGNTMGFSWDTPVTLSEKVIPFVPHQADMGKLVAGAYRFNPDWRRMAAGLEAAQAMVKKEKAGHWPKVALTGTLWRMDNDLDDRGLDTNENEDGWSVGIGLQMPIFSGFSTTHKINEAKARLRQMAAQQVLLKEGLAIQVKNGLIHMDRAQKIRTSALQAAADAQAHRELATRAYLNDLVDTQEVIESQILEALSRAKAENAQYQHAAARFNVDFVIGREVQRMMNEDK